MIEQLTEISVHIALGILFLASGLVLYRLVKGPSIADRVTAFDVLTCITIGILSVFSILSNNKLYIDVIFVLAFVAFFGAIAFAYYIKKRKNK